MRMFMFFVDDYGLEDGEVKCPECCWSTSIVYILATTVEEGEMKMVNGEFLCGSCMAELLAIKEVEIIDDKDFSPLSDKTKNQGGL